MRARTMNGYWCFAAPIGYRYKRISGYGNMLVRDEPYASILQGPSRASLRGASTRRPR
ncbi:hypothetical protein [Enterovirga aerilata]|uniref:hypothetical protein n=1 Tax=Enterovirga aerilata TaxID=2730920 RepID=UPI001FEECEC4|nr:hypothetical protein [Enterovirga sp. DB1703]